jgi:hypothetical protein
MTDRRCGLPNRKASYLAISSGVMTGWFDFAGARIMVRISLGRVSATLEMD